MSTPSPARSLSEAQSAAKFPVLVLAFTVLAGMIAGAVCIGGGLYLLIKSGKIDLAQALSARRAPAAQVATRTVTLDPMLVNLSDPSGHAYLRLGLALTVEEPGGAAGPSSASVPAGSPGGAAGAAGATSVAREREIPIRDTVLAVLGEQTSAALLEPGGKERLKQQLEAALAAHNADLRVHGLYFTDFLVQP
jgi:flagellar protein FliL